MLLQITQYKEKYQLEINALIQEIASEFDNPIALIGPTIKRKDFDKYWIAKKDDQVVGTVGLIKLKNKSALLKSMFVKKEYRGKTIGLSQLLLQTAIRWSKEEKIENLFLGTMTQFKAAHKFYKKNGFHKIDKNQLPLDFVHNPVDDVFYKLDLSIHTRGLV